MCRDRRVLVASRSLRERSDTGCAMRVAFVSTNREKLPDAVVPLGLLYVLAATPERHHRVLWDLCFQDDPRSYLAEQVRSLDPQVIAIGIRNLANNDYSGVSDNLAFYDDFIRWLRASSPATVVVGGAGFSVMPEQLMERLRPDFGIVGEGETAFPALLEQLEAGTDEWASVPGLLWFDDGTLCSTPRGAPLSLGELAVPDRSLVDPRYYAQFGTDSVQTKRGCPMQCTYCTYPQIEGKVSRQREPARVVDELESMRAEQPGPSHVFVVDAVFNMPSWHAEAVCAEMIARRWDLAWTCYVNPLGFDQRLAELMAQAGCTGIEVGADSGRNETLGKLKKGFSTEDIRRVSALAKANGLRDCHTFLLGSTGETLDDVEQTLDFIVDLEPFAAILMTWVDEAEAFDPELASRRQSFRAEIDGLVEANRGRFPRWIVPRLGVNYDPRLFRYLRATGRRGPLWQHLADAAGTGVEGSSPGPRRGRPGQGGTS